MERSPRIHFEFGIHHSLRDHYPGLWGFRTHILKALLSTKTSKVLVPMEYANHPKEEGQEIQRRLSEGQLPSTVLTDVYFAYHKKRNSKEYVANLRQNSLNFYNISYHRILDEVFTVFPGRVNLLPEWTPIEDVQSGGTPILNNLFSYRKVELEGDEAKTYQSFKELATLIGKDTLNREKRVIQGIKDSLQEDPDITDVISFFGANHTGLFIDLKKEGFNVTRSFPSPGVPFLNRHLWLMARIIRFFPDREITEEQWEKAFKERQRMLTNRVGAVTL